MKHLPFKSIYRENFEVVEQRQGRESRFPHDTQLPIIWRALDMEFRDGLPGRFARVDHRADGFHKIVRRTCAMIYCLGFNGARADGVRLMPLPDEHLVHQVMVVQQITRESRLGRSHRFRFYGGPDFQPEVRLAGRRVVFSDHALERFSSRGPNKVGEDMSHLLLALYGQPVFCLPVGVGHALVIQHGRSLLAFTYKESPGEFFITTCLTVKELSTLEYYAPPVVLNWHYGESFTPPQIRHWIPTQTMKTLLDAWDRKTPLAPPRKRDLTWHWKRVGSILKDITVNAGHGPASQIHFLDNIPGPNVMECKPGQRLLDYDEMASYKAVDPAEDWDSQFTERDAYLRGETQEKDLQA
jgi:hypothetical protein